MTTLTLRQYMDTRRTTAGDWNVTGYGTGPQGWLGKYRIPEDEYDAFLELAHHHVFVRGKPHSLLERHRPQAPILIDLDFRYTAGGPLHRRYTSEQVREFVAAYVDAFSRFFEPPRDSDGEPVPLRFFDMRKPAPEADKSADVQKDGVHLECATIDTSAEIQYAIRGYLLQTGAIERIFGATGMINDAKDCLDISVISRNNWFLYGGCKPDKAWYKAEHIYSAYVPESYEEAITSDHLEEEPTDDWKPLDLVKHLSIQSRPAAPPTLTLRASAESEWLQLIQRWGGGSNWAPKPKSPGLFGKTNAGAGADPDTPSAFDLAADSTMDDMVQVSGISVRSGYSTEDVALAYKLVRECLNPTRRCKNYHDWINTGLLLHNIAPTEESLRAWAELSRRVPGYNRTPDAIYKEKWTQLPAEESALQKGRKPLMMGTLHLWAKEDSEATYRAILSESNKEMAMLSDSGTHVSVADMVVRMYRHEFRCSPLKQGATAASMEWFQFTGHTWRTMRTFTRIRERLSNEVRNQYIHADREVGKRITSTTDESERQRLEEKRKGLLRVEKLLQDSRFKDNVMREVTEKFYDEEFVGNMNQDPTLVGFTNGVLELRHMGVDGQEHVFFRPGRPDDCISFQMGRGQGLEGIPFIPYDPAAPAPEHREIEDFFKKIYPDPVLREYVWTLYAACLEGANREQKFYVENGIGSNGKSKVMDLMGKTFGEYAETLSTTVVTRKRADAGSANPELVVLKCKRFISMSEPDEGEKINTSIMKQLSGEDMIKARGLFKDQDQFVIMGRIFMLCNDLPPVSSTDNGTWRRLRVVPHVAKFVDPGVATNPEANIHTKDLMLDGKIMRWRPYFAGMLVWYFENRFLRKGLSDEPAQVVSASAKYKEENDVFAAFAQECLVREVGMEIRSNDLMSRYNDWKKYNTGLKQLQKKEILQKMSELFGKPIDTAGKVFAGVRIVDEGEEISGPGI